MKYCVPDELKNDGIMLSSRKESILYANHLMSKQEIIDNFNEIRSVSSPEQRSKEWFDIRQTGISASDAGSLLGVNPYSNKDDFIMKKTVGSNFTTNAACYHGKKFEDAVVRVYEHINKCTVDEFGILADKNVPYILASPDGIVKPFGGNRGSTNIDYNPLASRMVEIKCPKSRTLKLHGKVYGEIVPEYYWIQTQMQMQVANICECDFAQYKIFEYLCKEDFYNDTYGDVWISKKSKMEKGVLIELLPVDVEDNEQNRFDHAVHIYPDTLTMDIDIWIKNVVVPDGYVFVEVCYYRVDQRITTLILRDREWFKCCMEEFSDVWNYILEIRKNDSLMKLLKTKKCNMSIIDFINYNTDDYVDSESDDSESESDDSEDSESDDSE